MRGSNGWRIGMETHDDCYRPWHWKLCWTFSAAGMKSAQMCLSLMHIRLSRRLSSVSLCASCELIVWHSYNWRARMKVRSSLVSYWEKASSIPCNNLEWKLLLPLGSERALAKKLFILGEFTHRKSLMWYTAFYSSHLIILPGSRRQVWAGSWAFPGGIPEWDYLLLVDWSTPNRLGSHL